MKRVVCLLLILALLLGLPGCGAPRGDDDSSPTVSRRRSSAPKEEEPAPKRTEPTPEAVLTEAPPEPLPTPAPAEALPEPAPADPEPEDSPQPVSAWHERAAVDPSSLPDDLLGFLARFAWVGRTDLQAFFGTDINCVLPLMNWGFELISAYDSYPGPACEWAESDALGRYDGCYVYDADKTEHILQTVYQVDAETVEEIREAGLSGYANFTYFDSKYYVSPLGTDGGFVCFPCYVEDDGVKLYIYYAVYYGDSMFYPAGLCYAEVSRADFDGQSVWSLDYWSRTLPVIGMPEYRDGAAALGDWVLADDGLSSLRMKQHSEGRYSFYAGFFRLIGFDAEAQLITDDGVAMFSASDGSGFQGWMQISEDELVLHIFACPEPDGYLPDDGRFNGRAVRFIRPAVSEPIAPDSFWISPDELEAEIERIRDYYYHPTSASDEKIVLSNGADGWNYSREYYLHDGKLVFAFIFNGAEEHRLYFKDGHLIRYIDEHKTTHDFGALEPFAEWERRALTEAAGLKFGGVTSPSDWLGTWYAYNGEWINVLGADETGIQFVYHHNSELYPIDTYYALPFLGPDHSSVAEDEHLLSYVGWRYCFYLEDGHIRVTSRYPDNDFYR